MIYCDLIHTVEKVSDQQAGALFKHILRYVNDQDPETDDVMTQVLFEPVRQTLKRDLQKWKALKERNTENGSKGGRPKGTSKPIKTNSGKDVLPATDGQHFFYLIYDKTENQYKVGETKDLHQRRLTIKRPTADLEIVDYIEASPAACQALESYVLRNFKEFNVSGNWLEIDARQVGFIVDLMNEKNPLGNNKTQSVKIKPDSVSVSVSDSDCVSETDKTEVTNVTTAKAVTTKKTDKKVEYGNPDINKMLNYIKTGFALTDFKEPQKQQRQYACHLLNLGKKLGLEEFRRRLSVLVEDDFKSKNCNSIKYLYRELKSVPAPDSILNQSGGSKIETL